MRPLKTDLSGFEKLNLGKPPVGVNFLFHKPEEIEQLDKQMALCEMLPEAQKSDNAFYFTRENESCFGKQALGMMEGNSPPFVKSGELGVKLGIFQDPRANKKLVQQNPTLTRGTVNYVVFAPLKAVNFEPDLLVLMAKPRQAEIVLRSMTYSTGELYESKTSTVLSCAWLYVYPYVSGKVNYYTTGMGFGSIGREVFEPGWVLIAIPYNWLPTLSENLNEMEFEPDAYAMGKEKFVKWEKSIIQELESLPSERKRGQ